MSVTLVVLGIGAIILFIGISAAFSSTELAVFSLPKHRIDAIATTGTPAAKALDTLRSNPHSFLVTVLVTNNVANIAAASVGTALLVLYFDPGVAATLGTVMTSVVVIVFGELAPKSYAVTNPERLALRMSRPVSIVQRVFSPVFFIFEWLMRQINRVTGGNPSFEGYLTREELETIVISGERSGAIDTDESAMIRGVLDLEETTVRGMMVPRGEIVSLPLDATLDEIIETCWRERVSRLPIYGDNRDDVRGVIDLRDALRARVDGTSVQELLEAPVFVPSIKPVDEVLAEMQADGHRMVFAVDEFGTVVGMATLSDAIEEVIGELFDREEMEPIKIVDADTAIVQGWATIDYVNEAMGFSLHSDGPFVTIAGLINHHLGRLAEEGDRVEFNETILTVLDTSSRRIRRVRIDRVAPVEGD